MHTAKVTLLLVLTLLVMRSASWLLGWLVFRFAKLGRRPSAWTGNGAAYGLFLGYLAWDLMPGEPFDTSAAVFGLAVYGVFQGINLKWCPWGRAAGADAPPSR